MNLELPRVVHADFADSIGISRARIRTEVRRGNWRVIGRGAVLTRPDRPTRSDWADLGIAIAGPTAALSGWDSLRVYGLADRQPPSEEVLVLSRHSSNRVVGQVRIRETRRPYTAWTTPADAPYPCMPVVQVSRAVADTSLAERRPGAVRAMVTGAVQKRRCTVPELLAELEACPRQRSALFRAALSDASDGARSAAEAMAARRMTTARLPAFEMNVPIVRRGVVLYEADVLWRSLRAVLEIDSREYHFSEDDWKATTRRHNALTRFGLALTHYPPSTVADRGSGWTREVADWLQARAEEIGVPVPRGHGAIRPGPDGPPPLVLP